MKKVVFGFWVLILCTFFVFGKSNKTFAAEFNTNRFDYIQNYIEENGQQDGKYKALVTSTTSQNKIRIISVAPGQINCQLDIDNGKTQHMMRMWLFKDKLDDTLIDYSCFSEPGTIGSLFFSCIAETRINITDYTQEDKLNFNITSVSFESQRTLAEQLMEQNGTAFFRSAADAWNTLLKDETGFTLAYLGLVNSYPDISTGNNLVDAIVAPIEDQVFTGTPIFPSIEIVLNGVTLKKDVDYTVKYSDNTNIGKATIQITGIGDYSGQIQKGFNIVPKQVQQVTNDNTGGNNSERLSSGSGKQIHKSANSMMVKTRTIKIKYAKLKNKKQTIKAKKIFKISNAKGKVSYKVVKNDKKAKKKIKVSKSGKITVKKGLKKGTYKLKVNVTAAGNANYEPMTKTVTVKVKVK